jgi:hypothetical protein
MCYSNDNFKVENMNLNGEETALRQEICGEATEQIQKEKRRKGERRIRRRYGNLYFPDSGRGVGLHVVAAYSRACPYV